jgi:hypothetical protein
MQACYTQSLDPISGLLLLVVIYIQATQWLMIVAFSTETRLPALT